MKINGLEIADQAEVADNLNSFFVNHPLDLKTKLVRPSRSHPLIKQFSSPRVLQSMFLFPTSTTEVKKCIMNLKPKKSSGEDGITSAYLKKIAGYISPYLAHVVNLSFGSGIFPSALKDALVVPLFKKGDPKSADSYRPISLLKVPGKVVEKLMATRLLAFLKKNSWLSPRQYGFQSGKSTDEALNDFSNFVYSGINSGKKVAALLLDVSRAFDSVEFEELLTVLSRAGVRGTALDWFGSYLHGRGQKVRLPGESNPAHPSAAPDCLVSNRLPITCSVPQGSNLGPILFIIYMNELCNHAFKGRVVAFADDTAILYLADTWEEVEMCATLDLQKLYAWFSFKGLTINISKTGFLPFHLAKDREVEKIRIICHGADCVPNTCSVSCPEITKLASAKYLGIWFDSNLKWHSHLKYINSSGRAFLRQMFFLRNVCPQNVLILLYRSLFESRISYGISIWGGTYATHLQPLIVTQKFILRTIARKPRLHPSWPLFSEFSLFPVRHLFIFKTLKLYFKSSGNLPIRYPIATSLRRRERFEVPFANVEAFKKSASYLVPKLLNALPFFDPEMSRSAFHSKLKVWLSGMETVNTLL